MELQMMDNKYVFAAICGAAGIVVTIVTQRIVNKRALFTYFVDHNRVGVTTNDPLFGNVEVTWNGQDLANLNYSTVQLTNQSMRDFEDVTVRVFSTDATLLTERAEVVGTTQVLKWTDGFAAELHVEDGSEPTEAQRAIHSSRRDYAVPVINRGQTLRFQFLTTTTEAFKYPTVWLDITHPGLRLKFRSPVEKTLGVSRPAAAMMGVLVGAAALVVSATNTEEAWVVGAVALLFGLFAQVPGALLIRAIRFIRDAIAT